ncbi:Holliday junction resolvase RecU [Listeria booriae]|uniref:Holliday junction resolvase RecU n=1 Tax=Listeria booriae TaxID=1552123 RepID=UPI0016289C2D|nr:Holliday junction resolvase RecU [Listeria booriae]MBC1888003.1 Holliday junction resolvase RecU [Listeria booriae]MBC2077653.1 Holliday junction resolvase RecU [Listeria booriae]
MIRAKSRTHANRGMKFESAIEKSCENYRQQKLAVVKKRPTDWTVRWEDGKIISAFPKKKSTVDFEGILAGGQGIAFEAKETKNKTSFPLSNFQSHQISYLENFAQMGGMAFVLIRFTVHEAVYKIMIDEFRKMISDCETLGRKSIPLDRIKQPSDKCYRITEMYELPLFLNNHYNQK